MKYEFQVRMQQRHLKAIVGSAAQALPWGAGSAAQALPSGQRQDGASAQALPPGQGLPCGKAVYWLPEGPKVIS